MTQIYGRLCVYQCLQRSELFSDSQCKRVFFSTSNPFEIMLAMKTMNSKFVPLSGFHKYVDVPITTFFIGAFYHLSNRLDFSVRVHRHIKNCGSIHTRTLSLCLSLPLSLSHTYSLSHTHTVSLSSILPSFRNLFQFTLFLSFWNIILPTPSEILSFPPLSLWNIILSLSFSLTFSPFFSLSDSDPCSNLHLFSFLLYFFSLAFYFYPFLCSSSNFSLKDLSLPFVFFLFLL